MGILGKQRVWKVGKAKGKYMQEMTESTTVDFTQGSRRTSDSEMFIYCRVTSAVKHETALLCAQHLPLGLPCCVCITGEWSGLGSGVEFGVDRIESGSTGPAYQVEYCLPRVAAHRTCFSYKTSKY